MPFKTRRQKISAQERSFVFSDGKISLASRGATQIQKEDILSLGVTASVENSSETRILKSELSRIIAISFVIIALQIGLHLAPISSYIPVLR